MKMVHPAYNPEISIWDSNSSVHPDAIRRCRDRGDCQEHDQAPMSLQGIIQQTNDLQMDTLQLP